MCYPDRGGESSVEVSVSQQREHRYWKQDVLREASLIIENDPLHFAGPIGVLVRQFPLDAEASHGGVMKKRRASRPDSCFSQKQGILLCAVSRGKIVPFVHPCSTRSGRVCL